MDKVERREKKSEPPCTNAGNQSKALRTSADLEESIDTAQKDAGMDKMERREKKSEPPCTNAGNQRKSPRTSADKGNKVSKEDIETQGTPVGDTNSNSSPTKYKLEDVWHAVEKQLQTKWYKGVKWYKVKWEGVSE